VCDVNPFHPSFGVSPPVLVGRDRVLEDVALGLDEGPGALERASLIIGVSGAQSHPGGVGVRAYVVRDA
jgi:hypothetical protein